MGYSGKHFWCNLLSRCEYLLFVFLWQNAHFPWLVFTKISNLRHSMGMGTTGPVKTFGFTFINKRHCATFLKNPEWDNENWVFFQFQGSVSLQRLKTTELKPLANKFHYFLFLNFGLQDANIWSKNIETMIFKFSLYFEFNISICD